MTRADRWIVLEARHTARLDASREQVLAAELDLAFIATAMDVEIRDVIESVPGVPHRWTQVARVGPLRQAYSCTLLSRDPHVTRSEHRDRIVQIATSTVDAAPGEDGRIGIVWTARAELTAPDPLGRWLLRAGRARQQRAFERRFAAMMARWAAVLESRAARERA